MPPRRTANRSHQGPSGQPSSSRSAQQQPPKSAEEQKKQWLNQYMKGKTLQQVIGSGGMTCVLSSFRVDFVFPFADRGTLEIVTNPRGGYTHFVRNSTVDRGPIEVLILPATEIEQVFIIFDTSADTVPVSDGMLQVIIIPVDAAGTSPLVNEYPEIIQFKWPNQQADDALFIANESGQQSVKESDTYVSLLKSAFDSLLAPFSKQVKVCVQERPSSGGPLIFKCPAVLLPAEGASLTENVRGNLLFISTGILWFSHTILYFLKESIMFIYTTKLLTSDSDLDSEASSDEEDEDKGKIGLALLEMFPEKKSVQSPGFAWFNVAQDFSATEARIKKYIGRRHMVVK